MILTPFAVIFASMKPSNALCPVIQPILNVSTPVSELKWYAPTVSATSFHDPTCTVNIKCLRISGHPVSLGILI